MDHLVDGCVDRQKDHLVDGSFVDRWIDRQTGGWMDGFRKDDKEPHVSYTKTNVHLYFSSCCYNTCLHKVSNS